MSQCATWPQACTPASVRPAAAIEGTSGSSLPQGLFQRLLHRGMIVLPLPAGKGTSVIFDFQGIAWHGRGLARRMPLGNLPGPSRKGFAPRLRRVQPPLAILTRRAYVPFRAKRAGHLVFSEIADRLTRGVEAAQGTVSEAFFEPVIRLGVTGLSRAGKTVFITSLVANLIDRGRMPQLVAAANGRIRTAYLQPQPDDTVPRFDYEAHLGALTSPDPHWPALDPLDQRASAVAAGPALGPDGLPVGAAHRASRHHRLSRRVAAGSGAARQEATPTGPPTTLQRLESRDIGDGLPEPGQRHRSASQVRRAHRQIPRRCLRRLPHRCPRRRLFRLHARAGSCCPAIWQVPRS